MISTRRLTVLNVAYPFAPVGPDAVGGAEQVLSAIDTALWTGGHRSLVVACEQSKTRGVLLASIPCHEVLSGDLCRFARSEHARAIREALAHWPVDVIHLHGVDFYEYLPETHVPVLVTLHLPLSFYPESVFHDVPPNVHFHCVSQTQARSCPPGVPLLPVIENGVNVDLLAARHTKRDFALALGRICPEKGFHLAVNAAKEANMPLLLAGETFGYESHRDYWRHELLPRLDARRRWIGPIDLARKRRLLTAARCVLVPSTVAETSSLVAMEALACGTPVIAYRNGALADIVEDGRTGFLVHDEHEMAIAIGRAREIDGAACRAAARQRFSQRRAMYRYLSLYHQLALERRQVESCHAA